MGAVQVGKKKDDIDLDSYTKAPRRLVDDMMRKLGPGGELSPILDEVKGSERLRLDIRDHRFNVYYRGGSLLCVDGRRRPWALHFDRRYFSELPDKLRQLLEESASIEHSGEWVAAFPELMDGMDKWWDAHHREERDHCQKIARQNSPRDPGSLGDCLVLDIEYQWAQRRLDLIAARRNPTAADPSGWAEPVLVFVEVKSDLSACTGGSGLKEHVEDYSAIVTARGGKAAEDIKREFESVIAQKKELGLFADSIGFQRFADAQPELLLVLVDLNPEGQQWRALLHDIASVVGREGIGETARFMYVTSTDYQMNERFTLDEMVAQAGL